MATLPFFRKTTFIILFIFLSGVQGCTSVFFQPSSEQAITPQEIGIEYEDVWIEDPGEPKLHAWFLPAKDPIATVLFLHGNAENISTHFASVHWMPAKGLSVFLLDYRGYGLSEGEASIEGIHKDITRASRYVIEHYKPSSEKLVLFGQSLGGSMALYSAAQPDLHEVFNLVVAESPFSSYRAVAQEKLASTWLTYPFQWLLPFLVNDSYSPIAVVNQIAPTPILLIHGTADVVVDSKNSEALFKKLDGKCLYWKIPDGAHIAAFRDKDFQEELVLYIKQLPSR